MTCDNPILQAVTVEEFKEQFYRDFTFIDSWVAGTYNTGDQVFYLVNRKFYKCLNDGVSSTPDTSVDWSEQSAGTKVSDLDISHAYAEACITFNDTLFIADDEIVLGYLYASAHYLVNDLNAGGVSSSAGGLVNSRSVGNVSESYSIPTWILDNPIFGFYAKTSYGSKYLNMILPRLVGNFGTVEGATTP